MTSHFAAIMKKRHSAQFDIHGMNGLAHQSVVKYGVLDASAVKDLFRNSARYERMWSQMTEDPDTGFVRTTAEGIERMLASTDERPWAFISDLTTLRYTLVQRTDLMMVIDPFSQLSMSLVALPIGSPDLDRLNLAMLEMLETAEIRRLHVKWWNQPQ